MLDKVLCHLFRSKVSDPTFLHQPQPNLDLDRETKVKSEQFFMDMQI